MLEMQDTAFLLLDVAIGILTYLSRLTSSSSDVTLPIFLTMIACVALKVPPSNVFLFQPIAKTCCMLLLLCSMECISTGLALSVA